MEVSPPGGDLEDLGGGLVLSGLAITSQREEVGGGEAVCLTCLLNLCHRVEHVFYCR